MSSSRGSLQPTDRTCILFVSCIGKQVLCHESQLGSPEITLLGIKSPFLQATHAHVGPTGFRALP